MSLVADRGQVWTVTLDRPRRANALSSELVEELLDVVEEAAVERPLALVLRGNDRHFSAGFDLTRIDDESDGSLVHRFLRIGQLLERLATAPHLTVAVVEGAAVGAGADLAAACDQRLATASATFRFPGARFGIVLGAARLAGLTGAGSLVAGELGSDVGRLVTGAPDDLDAILRRWSETLPSVRPALLGAARPTLDADKDLAVLARSVATPGLRDRIVGYADMTTVKETA